MFYKTKHSVLLLGSHRVLQSCYFNGARRSKGDHVMAVG